MNFSGSEQGIEIKGLIWQWRFGEILDSETFIMKNDNIFELFLGV